MRLDAVSLMAAGSARHANVITCGVGARLGASEGAPTPNASKAPRTALTFVHSPQPLQPAHSHFSSIGCVR